jgi:hypothetical protein
MSSPAPKGRIIVSGILFWYPLAGVTYQFLHYMLGLRKLGYDPYYIEDSERWIYDPRRNTTSSNASGNVAAVAPILEAYGFAGRWAYRNPRIKGQCFGMAGSKIDLLYKEADALLNVTGAQHVREEHRACPRRIYVETDPFGMQVAVAQGDPAKISMLNAHDTLFTFGENLGAPDCTVPVGDYTWLPTRQPVDLDLWEGASAGQGSAYTTITTWQNRGKGLAYGGVKYHWTKGREFRKFIDLPRHREVPFELAVQTSNPRSNSVKELICGHGWRYVDALYISNTLESYRTYIAQSRAEFTVARDQYVRPRTGWFSDRSACYLAAARPVITQETGFSKYLPTGRGLFAFNAMDDILSAVDAIESDYEGNCRAAKEIAVDYFAAEKVVGSLMSRAGL